MRTVPTVVRAGAAELPQVRDFYATVGYGGGAQPDDHVLVARGPLGLVAAVRLCEEEGCLVLRGMSVAAAWRGRGVGSALLGAVDAGIGERECWCVPYEHLGPFYSRIGFVAVEEGESPDFLVARAEGYRRRGQAVMLTRRPERRVGD